MIKKTLTFRDYNGNKRTEDFYFNLSKAELIEMQLVTDEGLENELKKIVQSGNNGLILRKFKEIIAMSVGKRSEDGSRFYKSDDITQGFMQSPAYDEFLMQLFTNGDMASDFVKGIVPQDLEETGSRLSQNMQNYGNGPMPQDYLQKKQGSGIQVVETPQQESVVEPQRPEEVPQWPRPPHESGSGFSVLG